MRTRLFSNFWKHSAILAFASSSSSSSSSYQQVCAFSTIQRFPARTTTASTTTTTTAANLWRGTKQATMSTESSTALKARTRGLEQRVKGATPTEGGMTLYLKAAEDGESVGDCPFAHFVRMVLEEKGLEYELRPCTPETKPDWLLEHYEGKMPALRHDKECYVESSVIAEYLDFFFSNPPDKYPKLAPPAGSESILEGFFPAVAQYIKEVDNSDTEKLGNLREKLSTLNTQLEGKDFLTGDTFTLLDCRLIPQLYIMYTCIEGFKEGIPNIAEEFPNLHAYYERGTARPSFQASVYPKETCLWGWGQARGN